MAQVSSKPDRDTLGRDKGYRGGGERFYCDGPVGVELEDNLGGMSSVKPLARRVAEPRAPDTGDSCRLCDDLPKNGPELDA